jgi:hypothetical protein
LGYIVFVMDETIKKYLATIGRKGGVSASKAKADAARENGKRGGRPKKEGKK